MKKNMYRVMCLVFLMALGGCAHLINPGRSPQVSLNTVPAYKEHLSVCLVNNQPDKSKQLFAGINGHTFYANYNLWTDYFIRQWRHALIKRGVNVSNESPNKIKVKLSDFQYVQGFAKVRLIMRLELESADGTWKKEYEETDTSGWSMGRAFGSDIYSSIERVLSDKEIIDHMRIKSAAGKVANAMELK